MLWVLIRIASSGMSTHNICFYGELMKIYPSVIIKYPPYQPFLCQFDLKSTFSLYDIYISNLYEDTMHFKF